MPNISQFSYPLLKRGATRVGPVVRYPETIAQVNTLSRMLHTKFDPSRGWEIGQGDILGASVGFDVSRYGRSSRVSFPLSGPVYSKETGELSGVASSVNVLDLQRRRSYSATQYITNAIGGAESPHQIQAAVKRASKFLRYEDIDTRHGAASKINALGALNKYRFRVSGPGVAEGPGFGDLGIFYKSGKMGNISELDLGVAQQRLQGLVETTGKQASAIAGRQLYIDPMSEVAMSKGLFSLAQVEDFDAFGRFRHGGFKVAQQFRLRGMKNLNAASSKSHKLGIFQQHAFGGRFLQSGMIHRAGMSQVSSGLSTGYSTSGMNIPTRLMFGEGAERFFSGTDQVILDPRWANAMGHAVGHKVGVGTALHGQGAMGKGNVAGIQRLHSGLGAMKFGNLKRTGDIFEAITGAYVLEMARSGKSRQHISSMLRWGFGRENFVPGTRDAILRNIDEAGSLTPGSGGRLFSGMSAKEATKAMYGVFGRLQYATGLSPQDLIKTGPGGVQYIDTMLHQGVRDNAFHYWDQAIRQGINVQAGERIGPNFAAIARQSGAPSLGAFFEDVQAHPGLNKAIGFGRGAMAMQAHLLGMENYSVKGMGAALNISQYRGSEKIGRVLQMAEQQVRNQGGDFANVARLIKQEGVLPELFRGPGRVISLGGKFGVEGFIGTGETSLKMSGMIDQIAVPNLARDDYLAYQTLKMLHGGPGAERAISNIAAHNFELFAGGKGSLMDKLAFPRLGDTLSSIAQTPVSSKGKQQAEYNRLMRRAGVTPGGDARYAFLSKDRMKGLSREQLDFIKQHGYLPSITVRQPATGRQFVAQRLVFSKDVRGDRAAIMKSGDINYLMGDVDLDNVRHIIAVGGDKNARKLMQGFSELERSQAARLKIEDRYMADTIRQAGTKHQTKVAKVAAGQVDEDVFSEYTSKQIKAGRFAQLTTKELTGIIDPEIKIRQIGLDAMVREGQAPFSPAGARAMSLGILPGILESAINKRAGAGNLTQLGMLNKAIKEGAPAGEQNRLAKNLLVGMYSEFAPDKGISPLAEVSEEVLGFGILNKQGGYISGEEFSKRLDDSPQARKFISEFVAFENEMNRLTGAHTGIGADIGVAPGKRIFSGNKRMRMIERALQEPTHGTIDPVGRRMLNALKVESASDVEISQELADEISSQISKGTAGKVSSDPTDVIDNISFKDLARRSGQGIMRFANKHPVAAGIAGLGIAAAGAGYMFDRVDRGMDKAAAHIATQTRPQTASPRTDYIMDDTALAGMQLTGSMSAPSDNINIATGVLNRLTGTADVRITDSRMPVSDRTIGMRAQDRMDSIYARPIF